MKYVPQGKWLCSHCCKESDEYEKTDQLESDPKRPRTTTVTSALKSGMTSPVSDKASPNSNFPNHGSKGSLEKVRSPSSRRAQYLKNKLASERGGESSFTKPSHGGSTTRSSFVNGCDENPKLLGTRLKTERRPSYLQKDVLFSNRYLQPSDLGTTGLMQQTRKRKKSMLDGDNELLPKSSKSIKKKSFRIAPSKQALGGKHKISKHRKHKKEKTKHELSTSSEQDDDDETKSSDVQKKDKVSSLIKLSIYVFQSF